MHSTNRLLSVLVGYTLSVGAAADAAAQPVTVDVIRDAASRGVAAIQHAQEVSQKSQTCAGTCHLQGYGAHALLAARQHRITVNEQVAATDARRAFARLGDDLSNAIEQNGRKEIAMQASFQLVAAHAVGLRPSTATAALARAIALEQNLAGDWTAMTTRPPSNASPFMFTAVSVRALQLYGHASQARDTAARIKRARAWLESHGPSQTEDRAYQLLGLTWAGASQRQVASRVRELLETQQPDGGWTSLDGRPADAYATGQALVALHDVAGMSLRDATWRRGLEYLVRTQAADGTWHVRTRLPPWVSPPYFESGYPYGRDQFISVAGASWAVMALTRALGEATVVERLPLAEPAPASVEPWVETAMFGSVKDLKTLLDGGLDPNAATASGRIPLLSVVTPDSAKMRLLIDRGADVNQRSRANISPIFVAAQYGGAVEAVRLLLERGARVSVSNDGAAAVGNAHPLAFAANAGEPESIRLLHKAGGHLTAEITALGAVPRSPLALASVLGRTEAVKALLELGAPVDQPGQGGTTPLLEAVKAHRIDIVRLLLDRGADVNHADARGMTALMHAATTDFGDAVVIEQLLKAGARSDVRDQEGLTAFERAERNGNARLVTALQRANSETRQLGVVGH